MSTPDQSREAINGNAEPQLDVSKLHSLPTEQQDLFLLTFVSELRQYVKSLSNESLPSHQANVKKEVIKIVGLAAPVPSRIVRQNLGCILADCFSRGSTQLLHETVNELLSFVVAGKNEKDLGTRHVATVCLGLVFRDAGTSAVSLVGVVSAGLLKLLKSASAHVGLRASIFRALAQLVKGLGASLDEQIARDVWKQARQYSANDKSAAVQNHACASMQSLICNTSYFDNPNDHESLRSTIWKVLDSSFVTVRKSAATTLAEALVRAYSEHGAGESVPVIKKPKKSKKQDAALDDDIEDDRSATPATVRSITKVHLSLSEILRVLSSHYCKASTNNRARSGLASCYKAILERLPERVVQEQYATIAGHFFYELLDHPTIMINRYRLLLTRRLLSLLLNEVVATSLLSENGRINAARWLINDVVKNYPKVIQERKEPSKRVLAAAIRSLSYLVESLGPAASSFQDSCREALFQALQHPSYTVQVHAAHCFRVFVDACPNQLARSIEQANTQIKKDLESSPESRSHRRALGCAMSVAAMLSSARRHPLHGSIELFSGAFSFSTELLKSSSSSELRLCATQVQIAWTIIGGLMSLGPSFVKVHLNQLLLLWRNALPPPLTRENSATKGQLEMSFLTHVRECALTALYTFLVHNSTLITLDGSKRISTMLHNSVSYIDALPAVRTTEDLSERLVPAIQLQDLATMLRRRVLQCMTRLMSLKNIDHSELASQSDVIGLTVRTFTNPEKPTQKSLEVSLASSASNFEGIWELGDNWGSGVNSLIQKHEVSLPSVGVPRKIGVPDVQMEPVETALLESVGCPIVAAFEHDAALLCCHDIQDEMVELVSAPTSSVTAAIQLFAIAFPLQPPRVQEGCMEQMATALAQPLQRDPGRKAVIQLNIATALLNAFAVSNGETPFFQGKLATKSISEATADILRRLVIENDSILRNVAAQALGRLCNLTGSQFTSSEIKRLIDTIVANRDPHARAGCALALGQVHSQVGAMAASYHLKTIVGVLLSLCSDSHPIVHFWALYGLAAVAESAGLTFSGYASSTLCMLAQLYSSDSHNDEAATLSSSNTEVENPTPLVIGQSVDAVINVLGPDLQDVGKTRNLILSLVNYFQAEDALFMQVQSLVCLGHISMYAPAHVQLAAYVHSLQAALSSENKLLQAIAATGLENLMKRSASEVLRVSKPGLDDDFWSGLDNTSSAKSVQNILRSWMQQTCLQETAEWVQRCQAVLSRTRVKKDPKTPAPPTTTGPSAVPDLADEDVAGLAASAAVAQGDAPDATTEGQEFLRWQTRHFAMQLLSEMLDIIKNAMLPDRIIPAESALQNRLADIVRVAFAASTAGVVSLRLLGLHILDQILKLFGKTPDPDFTEASLLEQYQAQISSALTPAFAADSSPELAAEAMTVCATFVATGIVTNIERMGRIFKVLSTGLENMASPSPEAAIGDLKGLTSNAQSMLKMSLLSGWAELELASGDQPYLEDIVQPFVPKLAPLWLSCLQEFAALRFEPEISNTLGGDYASGSLQERYGAFDREVRLKFFQKSWLQLVDAIAVLVEKDSSAVFDALDNRNITPNGATVDGKPLEGRDMSFREEPVAFFFILFGLAYEALVTQAREDQAQALAILNALKRILTPAVSGNAIYQDVVFTETTDTLDRLALTSNTDTQAALVDIARNLSMDHVVAKATDRDDKLSDDIDQLFELTRIIILVLTGLVPTLEDPPGTAQRKLTDASTLLVQTCFQALVDVSDVFPGVIRSDLHACIFHCYCTILGTGICQEEVIPQIMPIFRSFLQENARSQRDGKIVRLLRGSLSRMLTVLGFAQRRENENAIVCAKNTLLSMTVLLTSASPAMPENDPLVYEAISQILDCLQDVGLAKIAASCVRSFLMTNPKTACDEAIARLLWPRLLAFISDTSANDPETVKPTLIHALTASVVTLRGDGLFAAMALLVPMLMTQAQVSITAAKAGSEDPKKDVATRLLELAAADALAFRTTINMLEEEQRGVLEDLLRSAGVWARQRDETRNDQEARPAIALRMDF